MSAVRHHRLGRSDRFGGRPLLCRPGHLVVGIDNDMRATFFGARGVDAPGSVERSAGRSARSTRTTTSTSATARDRADLRAATATTSSWSSIPRRSRRTIGRRATRITDFTVNANGTLNAARGDAPALRPTPCSSSRRPTRSTATRPNRAAAGRAGDALGDRCRPPLRATASTRRCRIDADAALACSARRRSPPTCWCRSTAATSA